MADYRQVAPGIFHAYVMVDGSEMCCGHDHRSSKAAAACARWHARLMAQSEEAM